MRQPFASLYLHVPFCQRRKCDYCAFYSIAGADPASRRRYLARVEEEIAEFAGRDFVPLRSIFLGGGTPSQLTPLELRRLLNNVRAQFRWAADCEVSTEANPESLTAARIHAFLAGGVNRFSLGVQSFSPLLRRRLGRRGGLARLPQAVAELRACGVRNVGFDLMYALPGQTLEQWREDLRRALDLGPDHVSTYALTVEEQTTLARRAPPPTADELEVAMWDAAAEELGRAGLRRYEISNFAKPGHECRHNLDVWLGGTYLGLGPAACSFDGELRWSNPSSLDSWLQPDCPREEDPLPAAARAEELLLFGLRTVDGWELARFREQCGLDAFALRPQGLERLLAMKLLTYDGQRLRPTRQGLLFHNQIAMELL